MKICANPKCKKEFIAKRINIKTCSNKCSKIFYSIKKRKEDPEYYKLIQKKNREKNIDLARHKAKIYYYKNKKHRLTVHKKWRDRNKEQIKIQQKKYLEENKLKVFLRKRKYRSLKRKEILARNAKYRSYKLQAIPKFANLNKIKEIYKNCPKGYHVDHIIPLKGNIVCGLHVEWNLQYLPSKDNCSKSNKLILE